MFEPKKPMKKVLIENDDEKKTAALLKNDQDTFFRFLVLFENNAELRTENENNTEYQFIMKMHDLFFSNLTETSS